MKKKKKMKKKMKSFIAEKNICRRLVLIISMDLLPSRLFQSTYLSIQVEFTNGVYECLLNSLFEDRFVWLSKLLKGKCHRKIRNSQIF